MGIISDRNKRGGYASPKIMGGYGNPDYYKFYRQNGGALSKSVFCRIIRNTNKAIAEEVIETAEGYTLPHGIGRIEFRKRKNKVFVTGDGVKSNTPIDWKSTMELWEKDPRALRNKVKVRYTNMTTGRYSFRIKMFSRKFKNKEYFAFRFKRSFKRAFAKRINTYEKPKIDACINKYI